MNQYSSNNDIPVLTALTEEQVADYLQRNPEFLADRPGLIAALILPHHGKGGAISLVERQVSVLRDNNRELRHRLNNLLDNARANDHLFEKTRRLILSMLDTRQMDDCIDALFYSFQNEFDIEYSKLILLNPPGTGLPVPANQQAQIVECDQFIGSLSGVIDNQRVICSQLDPREREFIFGDQAGEIGSTATAVLCLDNRVSGVLAIGSRDPDDYCSSTRALFLNFIADVLARLLTAFHEDS